ncbi:class I SAM-dependent methyltransferase [Catenulispora sp. NF23]|uniref:class I SAM-dependent methyltransferase n=1 Tax=Catenulispora pinistramenti TaxID=2705254 RepID=UPI001BAE2648|nr:class I SAM-dependent methyltransferase [Catenulispora pinistramenti]MBS2532050.1 class I SAM-dependent methyltransferase [Catenulispora pinistramenti]
MRTLWTQHLPGPVVGLSLAEQKGVVDVVLGAESGDLEISFDLSGNPADQARQGTDSDSEPDTGDGHLSLTVDGSHVCTLVGGTVWQRLRLDSDITAMTAMTAKRDRTLAFLGTVAGILYAMTPLITPARAAALLRDEALLPTSGDPADRAARAAKLYEQAGSPTFAVFRLRHLAESGEVDAVDTDRLIAAIARKAAHVVRADPALAFEAGGAFARVGAYEEAVAAYQIAASSERHRTAALHAVGDCFSVLDIPVAAVASYRAAAASGPNDETRNDLYHLARRLEERGQSAEAVTQYEKLLPWGAGYRDVWARHGILRSTEPILAASSSSSDPVPPGLVGVVRQLDGVGLLPTAKRTIDDYDATFYERFENPAVSDSVKKRLEMINLFGVVDPARIQTSLDVGSGTLRYPQVLARYGVRSYGIDLRDAWIRDNADAEWKGRFAVADGTALPFRDRSFDLITCMMGTVNHLSAAQRRRFFAESLRTLRPDGRLVLSAWDPRCDFQSLLSFYSPEESDELRRHLSRPEELAAEITAAGFAGFMVTPFFAFPDWQVLSCDQPAEGAAALAVLAELDQLRIQRTPGLAGQMFLLSARRNSAPDSAKRPFLPALGAEGEPDRERA